MLEDNLIAKIYYGLDKGLKKEHTKYLSMWLAQLSLFATLYLYQNYFFLYQNYLRLIGNVSFI
jgi:hypothetical protein